MTDDVTRALTRVRGPKLLLTVAVALMLAMGMLMMAGSTVNAAGPAPVDLGAAGNFAVLSAPPAPGGAVSCTDSTIIGDVGSSGLAASVVQTNCTIDGAVIAPVSTEVIDDFNSAYDTLATVACDETLTGTLAGVTLRPGVYCFDAAATLTGTLRLAGSPTDTWLFKIGTLAPGALTGTNFNVVMSGGANPCNVTWWVDAAATLTTSNFIGTILAGQAISVTGGTFAGSALAGAEAAATAGVTLTEGATLTGCIGGNGNGDDKEGCNQGVGNGPEECDPGNSNQGDESRSNDELEGAEPGDPGRQGGNGQ